MGSAINRAILYDQLHYTERHIAAGEEAIEKQRQGVVQIEARAGQNFAFWSCSSSHCRTNLRPGKASHP
jgi:hypothetical protein